MNKYKTELAAYSDTDTNVQSQGRYITLYLQLVRLTQSCKFNIQDDTQLPPQKSEQR
jgi:hypothetical protein